MADACKKLENAGLQLEEMDRFIKNSTMEGLQEHFTATFDFEESTAPYAAFQAFNKEADKAAFMAYLAEVYASKGHIGDENQLPDYLPHILKFLYAEKTKADHKIISATKAAAEKIAAATRKMESPYSHVYHGLAQCTDKLCKRG